MTHYLLDPIGEPGSAAHCPGCGSGNTVWVRAGDQDNLLCKTCGTCWHETARRAERVHVEACAGCEHRDVCLAAQGL